MWKKQDTLEFGKHLGEFYLLSSVLLSAGTILAIATVLLFYGGPAVPGNGWQLLAAEWIPSESRFGVLPMVTGSLMVTALALALAVPIGILCALYTAEFLSAHYRPHVKGFLELLAGIPSIVYGLVAVSSLSLWVESFFDLESGRTILTAGVVLAVMILPTIITFSDDAFSHVPGKYREAASGLGLYRYEVIKEAILPIAMRGLVGAVLLGLSRALGETMAVMLVIGGIDQIPSSVLDVLIPGQTITSKLGRELPEAAFGSSHFDALVLLGLILLVIVIALTSVAHRYLQLGDRLYE